MMEGVQCRREYKIDHFQQRFTWDCGLTCISMILPQSKRKYFFDNFTLICEEGGFGQSTWTIDLCYILKKLNIHHIYLTKTLGIDPSYYKNGYYSAVVNKDKPRVMTKLRNAESNGITIDQRIVAFNDFIIHLDKHGPIILLTNSTYLCCDKCKTDIKGRKTTYAGHYVVLCGYDLLRKSIFYRNPTRNHMCVTSFQLMNEARIAFGTDEDVILIYNTSCS